MDEQRPDIARLAIANAERSDLAALHHNPAASGFFNLTPNILVRDAPRREQILLNRIPHSPDAG
jgi:hypothetical protein